ncbi:MAG: carbohydrate kinase family protein, partial [Alicyclobacillus sp.]|nr:carbohydrate kinase family protein [Alicyclobacillus sp.]
LEVRAQRKDTTFGGSAVTTARVLGWLGLSVELVGTAGRADLYGDAGRQLSQDGVGLRHLLPTAASAETFVLIDGDGERTMISHEPAESRYDLALFPASVLQGASFVFLSAYSLLHQQPETLRAFLSRLREAGAGFAVNLCPMLASVDPGVLGPVLEQADVVSGNEAEWRYLTGATAGDTVRSGDELLEAVRGWAARHRGAVQRADGQGGQRSEKCCYVTRGGRGAVLVQANGVWEQAPDWPLHGLDTTGAGDAFFAGVLAAKTPGRVALELGVSVAHRMVREQWLHEGELRAGDLRELCESVWQGGEDWPAGAPEAGG